MKINKFIPPHPLNTAVLFLVFNRLDTTKQVFEAIRQAKPPRLYIAADGARELKVGEAEKVKAVRDYVMSNIDWECEVKTLFREQNLGCKYAVSGAIDWFFENEEMGIILEDDCLPSQSFFWFCEELLEKYKDDMRVWNIGGYKPPDIIGDEFSYTFSIFPQIWGWATWRSRWKYYDVNISVYRENKNIVLEYEYFKKNHQNISRMKSLDNIIAGKVDTWDSQWNFTLRSNHALSIKPNKNLIQNIGFGADATHTFGKNREIEDNFAREVEFPLKHPYFMMVHKQSDEQYSKRNYDDRMITRIKNKLNRMFLQGIKIG